MLNTLSQAQQVVEEELALLVRGRLISDRDRLGGLGEAVGDLSTQADLLLLVMLERDADADLVNMAKTLVGFFRDTERQIVELLGQGHR